MINRLRKKFRETTPFTITTNNIKYIGVTLTKQVKDLYDAIVCRLIHLGHNDIMFKKQNKNLTVHNFS